MRGPRNPILHLIALLVWRAGYAFSHLQAAARLPTPPHCRCRINHPTFTGFAHRLEASPSGYRQPRSHNGPRQQPHITVLGWPDRTSPLHFSMTSLPGSTSFYLCTTTTFNPTGFSLFLLFFTARNTTFLGGHLIVPWVFGNCINREALSRRLTHPPRTRLDDGGYYDEYVGLGT